MQVNNIGKTLFFGILLVIIITMIYYYPSKQTPTVYINAEKDKKEGDDDIEQKQIEKKESDFFDDKYNNFQFNYTNLKIPHIYQRAINGSSYKFNSTESKR